MRGWGSLRRREAGAVGAWRRVRVKKEVNMSCILVHIFLGRNFLRQDVIGSG
jgi:hypothetical protein